MEALTLTLLWGGVATVWVILLHPLALLAGVELRCTLVITVIELLIAGHSLVTRRH